MTAFEGRALVGLDEFMLRLGHLSVLVELAFEQGGSRHRVARALAEWLVEPSPVLPNDVEPIGHYMAIKRLAKVVSPGKTVEPSRKARYRDHIVTLSDSGDVVSVTAPDGEALEVWREDALICAPETLSKVGAVTVETRTIGNKSGVSHLMDWAVALGVLDKNLNPGAEGHVLHLLWRQEVDRGKINPYVVQGQCLAFAWLLFQADGDVLAAILRRLPRNCSVNKAEAIAVFRRAFAELYEEAYSPTADATAAAVRRIRDLRADLALPASAEAFDAASSSTLWHRLSSRLESLVDIGFLDKYDDDGQPRPFDYVYRVTGAGASAADSLSEHRTTHEWVMDHLGGIVARVAGVAAKCEQPWSYVARAIEGLLGPTAIHIDSCALLAASFALADGVWAEIIDFRECLIGAALRHPGDARLSRGYSGERPEFITFDAKVLTNPEHFFG